ncbi:hypothetical protein GOBAR_DD12811 [Gossypium barbadense]|nr:hypothetical protein GOBAR_DD12811 [Gossypium barbadense]
MKHLKNLRYLDLRECDAQASMPVGLGQLSYLRNLSKFVVGKDNGCGIDELKELALDGELSIVGLGNMMDLLLPNLVEISLEYCQRCDQLPRLGKLRFLKVLTIRRMDVLKHIGSSFYGDMGSSFPLLEVFKIRGAPCLEEWTTVNGGEHFPLLSSLTIYSSPS